MLEAVAGARRRSILAHSPPAEPWGAAAVGDDDDNLPESRTGMHIRKSISGSLSKRAKKMSRTSSLLVRELQAMAGVCRRRVDVCARMCHRVVCVFLKVYRDDHARLTVTQTAIVTHCDTDQRCFACLRSHS